MKMKHFPLPVLALSVLLLNPSCQVRQPERDRFFAVYADDGSLLHRLVLGRSGQTVALKMLSGSDWRVEARPEWLEARPMEGSEASRILTLEVSANPENEDRQGEIAFAAGGETVFTMEVFQYGKDHDDTPDPPGEGKGRKADLLDISFSLDGEAVDVSPARRKVRYFPSLAHLNYYNSDFGRNVARFNHGGQHITEGYYQVDYRNDPQFTRQLQDGHSMEAVFSCTETPSGSMEIKMFSSHERGGTGFLISAAGQGNCLTFLPNVSVSGKSRWIWTKSGITPQAGRFYHVVGVWDKDQGESRIYVDGVWQGRADACGELVLPETPACYWFGIGTDASPDGGQSSLGGEIVLARIYDDPLTSEEVKLLYEDVREGIRAERPRIEDVEYLTHCRMPAGYWYHIFGKGFQEGDRIRFLSRTKKIAAVDCRGRVGKDRISIQLPPVMESGEYNVLLLRGDRQYPIGPVKLEVGTLPENANQTRCVAHRCYHGNGASDPKWPENSLAAFKRTQELGVWGCEIDVWITRDGVILVNHNASFPTDPKGRRIENSDYSDLKALTLANGEPVPTLDSFLEQMKTEPELHLVLEIKTHSDRNNLNRLTDKCIEKIRAEKLLERVVWIAFDYATCRRIAAALPEAMVMYLGGDVSPADCKADGIMGIDYNGAGLREEWIAAAHRLGMKVNVWTINDRASMAGFIAKGVDYITTDRPEVLQALLDRQFVTAE